MQDKKLIYPISFTTYPATTCGFSDPMSGIAADYEVNGVFKGRDVKTKKLIKKDTYQYFSDYSLSTGSDEFLSSHDILFLNFVPFNGYSIDEDKPSFEEVHKLYEELKAEGTPEEEINNIVIEHFAPKGRTRK